MDQGSFSTWQVNGQRKNVSILELIFKHTLLMSLTKLKYFFTFKINLLLYQKFWWHPFITRPIVQFLLYFFMLIIVLDFFWIATSWHLYFGQRWAMIPHIPLICHISIELKFIQMYLRTRRTVKYNWSKVIPKGFNFVGTKSKWFTNKSMCKIKSVYMWK